MTPKLDKSLAVPEETEERSKIDVAVAFKMRFGAGRKTFREIADYFKVTPQAVQDRLKHFTDLIKNSQDVSLYDTQRANILTAVEFELTKDILDKGKREKATLGNVAYALRNINEMVRLEKGQPTAITEHISDDLRSLIDKIAPLRVYDPGSVVEIEASAAS